MRRYTIEYFGVQRGPLDAVRTIRAAEAQVNHGHTSGLIDASALVRYWGPGHHTAADASGQHYLWVEEAGRPLFRRSGDGVTVMGVARWVDDREGLHYRVVAERIETRNVHEARRESRPWGLSERELFHAAPLALVYPELWIGPSCHDKGTVGGNLTRRLSKCPGDRDSWLVLNGWCEDTNDQAGAEYTARALRRLDDLAECFDRATWVSDEEVENT